MSNNPSAADDFAQRIEAIEQAYELMIAYAAQGRESDEDSDVTSDVRGALNRMDAALGGLADAAREAIVSRASAAVESYAGMLDVLADDSAKARAGVQLVLGQRAISSQAVDNLNATMHLRAVITDLFLIDETLMPVGGH